MWLCFKVACILQVVDDEVDDWEYAWTEDQDVIEENKDKCFIAKLFKADSIGTFDIATLSN